MDQLAYGENILMMKTLKLIIQAADLWAWQMQEKIQMDVSFSLRQQQHHGWTVSIPFLEKWVWKRNWILGAYIFVFRLSMGKILFIKSSISKLMWTINRCYQWLLQNQGTCQHQNHSQYLMILTSKIFF